MKKNGLCTKEKSNVIDIMALLFSLVLFFFAGKYEGKINAGKDLTGTELYTLANANAEASINESAAKIEKELTGLGVKGGVKKVAQALAKDAAGAELSASERRLLSSEAGEKYTNEVQRSRAFEADLSKYAPEQRATVQKAIDSGILNNTKTTHFFVDFVAKISADKGVSFDFINNEKLKESGLALPGVTVNGYVSKDGIAINVNSAKALNSVVGHEITHVLEGTEFYDELQTALFSFAESKGEYQSRYEELEELYKDLDETALRKELAADLVGDYIFTDEKFVRSLSTEHKNVFQRIYDEIKYLWKSATAGSAEARELEKIKKIFDKVYSESTTAQKNTADGGVRYSISPTFISEYDAWDKVSKGGYFKIGSTSTALESVGIKPSSIYWDKSKIIKIKKDHPEMTDDVIKQVPNLLEDPVMIMQSATVANRVVVLGEVYAEGSPVLCALELKPNGQIDNFIKVASAYPKNSVQNLVDTSDILYLDPNKKRTDSWLSALRLQLPAGVTNYGSIGSVTYSDRNVKGEIVFPENTDGKSAIQAAFAKAGYTDQSGQEQYTQKKSKNSLSPEGTSIAPPVEGYNVRGEDVMLAPKVEEDAEIDIAPPVEADPEISIAPKVESEKSKSVEADEFTEKTLNSFGVERIGDYIHVQRQVFDTLLNEGFFTNTDTRSRTDINEETGMVIETNKSSIRETFNLSNYSNVGKKKKIIKLATVRMLPDVIRKGNVVVDNAPNQHNNSTNKTFAYITYDTQINGKPITIKLDIKQSPSKNKLWVHSILTKENSTDLDVSSKNGRVTPQTTDAIGEIIPQETDIVNTDDAISIAPPIEKDAEISIAPPVDEGEKQRKWAGTATESNAVDGKILIEDLDQGAIHYEPISNKKTLNGANARLGSMGYESSVAYFNSQFANKKTSVEDIVLGERLIQEAIKRGDTKTAGELIQNVAILGTELGQKVQALSIIKRLTPEGQISLLNKTIERGKAKGDKAYEGVDELLMRIERVKRLRDDIDADYSNSTMYICFC